MYEKKGNILLGLLLFLSMFFIPFLALGGNASRKPSGTSENSHKPEKQNGNSSGFRILDTSTGKILTVQDRPFLYGAVAAEMSPLANQEALKAQAVASYTYYSRLRKQQRKSPSSSLHGADFSAVPEKWETYVSPDVMRKRWGDNFQKYDQNISEAVDTVFGQVLEYNGQLIDATYFAISSGNTESAENVWGGTGYPYLISVASPLDVFAGGYETTVTYSEQEMKTRILRTAPKADLSGSASGWIGATECSSAGTVKSILLGGQKRSGNQARSAFNLRSANFTVAYADGNFTFTVKGYGHNVGMSQTGAQAMAKQGADYKQILAWYYPSAALAKQG
jgi:stage II sporulation protein D